jgi:hypothetical protein
MPLQQHTGIEAGVAEVRKLEVRRGSTRWPVGGAVFLWAPVVK